MSNIGLKPRNQNEIQIMSIMTRCHDWLADELGIESKMEFGRTCNWGKNAFHAGLWFNSSKQSVLNFRNLYGASVERMLKIVAHEARHAVQYRDGMMKDEGRNVKSKHDGRWEIGYWKGEYFSGRYKDAPWEIDARAHEKPYSQLIIDSGIITKQELALTLNGKNTQVVVLEKETRSAIKEKHGKVSFYKASKITEQQDEANRKEFEKIVTDAGFEKTGNKWHWKNGLKLDHKKIKEMEKIFKKAKKDLLSGQYCNDSIAFLTVEEEKTLPKDNNKRFWAAQKNRVFYNTRPMTDEDLVF